MEHFKHFLEALQELIEALVSHSVSVILHKVQSGPVWSGLEQQFPKTVCDGSEFFSPFFCHHPITTSDPVFHPFFDWLCVHQSILGTNLLIKWFEVHGFVYSKIPAVLISGSHESCVYPSAGSLSFSHLMTGDPGSVLSFSFIFGVLTVFLFHLLNHAFRTLCAHAVWTLASILIDFFLTFPSLIHKRLDLWRTLKISSKPDEKWQSDRIFC